jgi:hypothetical protein
MKSSAINLLPSSTIQWRHRTLFLWARLFQARISDISFPNLSLFYLSTDILKYFVHTFISFNLKGKVSNVPRILERGKDGFYNIIKNNSVLLHKSTILLIQMWFLHTNLSSRFFRRKRPFFLLLFTISGQEVVLNLTTPL